MAITPSTPQPSLLRAELASLPRFIPGSAAPASASAASEPARMANNEMPFPLPPAVVAAASAALDGAQNYPEPFGDSLRVALADHYRRLADTAPDIPAPTASQFVTGGASLAIVEAAIRAVVTAGDEVITPWRSFEAYPNVVLTAGGTHIRIPLTASGEVDLPAMAGAITDRTRAIIVCSPNNPSGTVTTAGAFADFMRRVPAHVLVVVDEAYHEFIAADSDAVNGLRELPKYPNLLVLRTFSKAYGLAGLRVGYAVASEELAADVRVVLPPFSANAPALAAACAALGHHREYAMRWQWVRRERDHMAAELTRMGFSIPASQANFLWLPLADQAEAFAQKCATAGLSVKAFKSDGVRVNIASRAANRTFIEVARDWMNTVGKSS